MANRTVQCQRIAGGKRCTRRAGAHGYCDQCWNWGLAQLRAKPAPAQGTAFADWVDDTQPQAPTGYYYRPRRKPRPA